MLVEMHHRVSVAGGVLITCLVLTGCGSGSSSPSASPTSSATTAPPASTAPPATTAPPGSTATTAAVAAGAPTCPTMAQADGALGGPYTGPASTALKGGGILCRYSGGAGTAAVAIYAHQTPTVFAGQVANSPGAPAMPRISGVGDGAFGQTSGGFSIVNAYSNGSRTAVAAQAQGTTLAPVEALARVALADN